VRTGRKAEEGVEMRSARAEGAGKNPAEYAPGAHVCPRADSNPEAQELLEQIVAPENMRKDWRRVKHTAVQIPNLNVEIGFKASCGTVIAVGVMLGCCGSNDGVAY